jgi:hypothetical protein
MLTYEVMMKRSNKAAKEVDRQVKRKREFRARAASAQACEVQVGPPNARRHTTKGRRFLLFPGSA